MREEHSGNYSVRIEAFAERYFIKRFQKKYNRAWDMTLRAIEAELSRIDAFLCTDKAETIIDGGSIRIIKMKFRVVGTKQSANASGNRCIVAWHRDEGFVAVLLVYGKTDLVGGNETAQWRTIVSEQYPQYRDLV